MTGCRRADQSNTRHGWNDDACPYSPRLQPMSLWKRSDAALLNLPSFRRCVAHLPRRGSRDADDRKPRNFVKTLAALAPMDQGLADPGATQFLRMRLRRIALPRSSPPYAGPVLAGLSFPRLLHRPAGSMFSFSLPGRCWGPGRREALRVMELGGTGVSPATHEVLSRARWNGRAVVRKLLASCRRARGTGSGRSRRELRSWPARRRRYARLSLPPQ